MHVRAWTKSGAFGARADENLKIIRGRPYPEKVPIDYYMLCAKRITDYVAILEVRAAVVVTGSVWVTGYGLWGGGVRPSRPGLRKDYGGGSRSGYLGLRNFDMIPNVN